ncbi:MAG: GNAT family N-acetyltransferase [Bacillota bacterium]
MAEIITGDRNLRIRRMSDDPADVTLMSGWLTDPRVLEFYEGRDRPFDERLVREKYAPRTEGGPVVPCIIEEATAGSPIGYIQFYPVGPAEAPEYGLGEAAGVYGLDLFLGWPEEWGKGLGARTLRLMLAYLFQTREARRVVVDPHVGNPRAIRAYEKVGFRRVKLLPAHEWHEGRMVDCWLMIAERPVPTGARPSDAE